MSLDIRNSFQAWIRLPAIPSPRKVGEVRVGFTRVALPPLRRRPPEALAPGSARVGGLERVGARRGARYGAGCRSTSPGPPLGHAELHARAGLPRRRPSSRTPCGDALPPF